MVNDNFIQKSYSSSKYMEAQMNKIDHIPEQKVMDIEEKLWLNESKTVLLIEEFLKIAQEMRKDDSMSTEKRQQMEQKIKKLLLFFNIDPRCNNGTTNTPFATKK